MQKMHTLHTYFMKKILLKDKSAPRLGQSGNKRCPFEVRWNEKGKLCRKRFAKRGDALAFARKFYDEGILPQELKFDMSERLIFAQIKTYCQDNDLPLAAVIDALKAYQNKPKCAGKDWQAATFAYFEDLERRGARQLSIDFYKSRLQTFENRETPKDVAEITTERAEKYLAGILSPEHAKRALRAFYSFCVDKKWVAENPFAIAKTPKVLREKEPPSVLSVKDAQALFNKLPAVWLPAVALMAFAGIRPAEAVSVDGLPAVKVGNIDFANKKITIPPEVSKVRQTRILDGLPANLWAWLAPLDGLPAEKGVAPASYAAWRKVKAKYALKLKKDVLRHSFASYGFHALGAEKTVEILGHVGGFGVFAKYYKGLATDSDAKAYFSILPKSLQKKP